MNEIVFDQLITVQLDSSEEGEYLLNMEVNPSSHVFEGHFPSQPVLPGVTIMAAVKRAVQVALNQEIQLDSMSTCKFLRPIIPGENNTYRIQLSISEADDLYVVKSVIAQDDQVYSKLSARYRAA